MDQDIASAPDSLALQRIQAQDYRIIAAAESARRVAEDAAAEAFRAAVIAHNAVVRDIMQQQLAVLQTQASQLASADQERWMELFDAVLRVRLGPAIITSSTPADVKNAVVMDAASMTVKVWPVVAAELAKLGLATPG